MKQLFRKSFKKPVPVGATINQKRGKSVARWIGKGGKEKTAPVEMNSDGSFSIRLERKTWMARFRNSERLIVERSTGCRLLEAAQVRLADFVRKSARISSGILTQDELLLSDNLKSTIVEQIECYADYLTRRKTHSARVKSTKAYLFECANGCGWTTLADLNADGLQRYLDLKSENKIVDGKVKPGTSPGALNGRIECWVAFGYWLAGKRMNGKRSNKNGEKRLPGNPFDGFARYDAKLDCRRKRRALTEAELIKLLQVAARRPLEDASMIRRGSRKGKQLANLKPATIERLKWIGRERALIYKTLVLTGLRKGELASIRIGQCHLKGSRPFIELKAIDEKNREGSDIPIRPDLAAELHHWIAEKQRYLRPSTLSINDRHPKPIGEIPLFDVPDGLIRILDRDLESAKIPKKDERGRSVDVHALRHSFGTMLSTSGVAPRVAQAAMRHSDLGLTMNVYTDPKLLDVHSALASLPSLDTCNETEREQATGTDSTRELVPPLVHPHKRPNQIISDNSGNLGVSSPNKVEKKKRRESLLIPAFPSVGATGDEHFLTTFFPRNC